MDKLSDIVKPQKPSFSLNKLSKATDTVKNVGRNLAQKASTGVAKTKVFLTSRSPIAYIVMGLLFIIVVLLILFLTQNLLSWIYSNVTKKYILLDSTKDAATEMVISQDPSLDDSITIQRSDNEEGGIEFTYSFWLYVNDWYSQSDGEQHVFHKGEQAGSVNFAPKVTLDAQNNTMYVYMNTFNTQEVKVQVDNLPVKKWMNVCLVFKHKDMDVYINGFLKRTHTFDSLPKQNYRNIYINQDKGFSGYFSSLTYYKYALTYFDIQSIMNEGPSSTVTDTISDTLAQIPPYLSPKWWS